MPDRSLPLRTQLAVAAGLGVAGLSRKLGKGEGSVIGGRVSLAVDPHSLERLAARRDVTLVSGTNGKTTTTSLLTAALRGSGEVVTNLAGSNMFGGMVGALSGSSAPRAVLEVDEGHLPKALASTDARCVVLLNLTRDQLDRIGEVRFQAKKWREALEGSRALVIANADDPMVVWAAQVARSVVWVAGGTGWTLDSASCPECGSRIEWSVDRWSCTGCALVRPQPHSFVSYDNHRSHPHDIHLSLETKLPGEVNLRNAAIALTAATVLGADPTLARDLVAQVQGAGGRFETVTIGGHCVRLILAKNPASWTEALRIARNDRSPLVAAINARVQDGKDPSWLWDVPYEQLNGRHVVATGDRGRDLAVRLHYADVSHEFRVNLIDAIAHAVAKQDPDDVQPIDVLGNYSAFQDFRRLAQ